MNTATDDLDALTTILLSAVTEGAACRHLDEVLNEFCHVLRNRLNVLKLGIYLAQQGEGGPAPALGSLSRQYRGVESLVDSVQAACRPMRLVRVAVSLGSVLEERRAAWTEALSLRDQALEWSPPRGEAPTLLDPGLLLHALDELVAWRSVVGRSSSPVRVEWQGVGEEIRLDWIESAPSAPDPERDRSPALALPLLARVAAAHGGRLELPGGSPFRLSVFLPTTRVDQPPATPPRPARRSASQRAS